MTVTGYVVLDPNGDRPYFSSIAPKYLLKKPGVRLFEFSLEVPDDVPIDGHIKTTAVPVFTTP